MSNPLYNTTSQLRQFDVTTITPGEATFAFILASQLMYVWVNNVGGQDDGVNILTPVSKPAIGRWVSVKTPPIQHDHEWDEVSKDGSTLSDLDTRSATDLNTGTIETDRLPTDAVTLADSPDPLTVLAIALDGSIVQIKINKDYIASNAAIPFDSIDFTGIEPSMVNAESPLSFDKKTFNRSGNFIKLLPANATDLGGIKVAQGLNIDPNGCLSVDFGTGETQALQGTTPFGGDIEGEHGSAVVSAIQTIPITIESNQVSDKDKYVLTLDSSNPETPFFYLAPAGSSSPVIPNDISSFTSNTGTLEIGQKVINPTFTVSYDGVPTVISLIDTVNGKLTPGPISPFTFVLSTPGSVIFTLTATFANGDNSQKQTSIQWQQRIYYGISLNQYSYLSSSRSGSFDFDASIGQYILFSIPSSMGAPKFTVGGFSGGFQLVQSSVPITNAYGITVNYDIWRSDNSGLGQITVGLS